jgi:hypothetical protein
MSEIARTTDTDRFPFLAGMGAVSVDVETSKSLDRIPSCFCCHTSRPNARQVVRL